MVIHELEHLLECPEARFHIIPEGLELTVKGLDYACRVGDEETVTSNSFDVDGRNVLLIAL